MKFRKEMIIFSLLIIFMLMSAVSAEENITSDDGTIASDYVELDSDSGYNENVGDNSILEDNVIDDENISDGDSEPDISPGSLDGYGFSVEKGFNAVANAGVSLNKCIDFHKSSSYSHYSKNADVGVNINGMFSNSQSLDDIGFEALNSIFNSHTEDFSLKTHSSYREYFNYLKLYSLKKLIGDVSNGNTHIADYLEYDLINFMDARAKYDDSPMMNLNTFLDIFDKTMNSPTTYDVVTKTDSYGGLELFVGFDSTIPDMLIIHNGTALINQTFDLKTVSDICINSYEDESDLHSSDEEGAWRDAYDNSDETVEIQSFEFSQQINRLSSDMSKDIQHTFYHMIGCECTNTGLAKQYASYDDFLQVSEFDTITRAEEDNHDNVLFKKVNVNAPFIVENASIFALFGVIKITIP